MALRNSVYEDPETREQRPGSAPDLGPGHDRPAGKKSDPRSENAAAGDPSDPRGEGSNHLSRGALQKAEASGDEPYNPDDNESGLARGFGSSRSTGRNKSRFRLTRRRALIGGGLTGVLISIILSIFSISSGPLEFVHIMKLLDKFHFSAQQDAEDSRLMKVARYLHDPNKPQNTRLGIAGNAIANKLESRIHDATGLTAEYDSRSGRFKGYRVDRNHEKWKDKSATEIKAQLDELFPSRRSVTVSGGEIIVNPDVGGINTIRNYRAQIKTSRGLLGEAGLSKVTQYMGSRVLKTRAGWTFHPIRALDAKIQAKVIEGGAAAKDKLKEQFRKDEVKYETTGVEPVNIDASNGSPKDKNGNPTDPNATPVADSANSANADVQDAASALSNGTDSTPQLKSKLITKFTIGGAAGIGGILCILEGLNNHIHEAVFTKAILPMMRMAGEAMNLGSQVQSGQDITALQLGSYKDLLDTKDNKGNVTSTWNQARSFQAELGQPQTGPDLPKAGQVFNHTSPLDFVNSIPGLSAFCSAISSPIGIAIQVITGPVSAIISYASGPLVDQGMGVAAGWLTGAPVDPLASGADRGNYMNYGARLSANDQFASTGGVQLSSNDETTLAMTDSSLEKADFQSHSLAYRLFNPYDERTLMAHIIDDNGARTPEQNVATLARNFGSIISAVFRIPATLLSGIARADSQPYDWHGLKKVGFTADELADKRFENPFDNACYVAGHCKLADGTTINTGILDGPNGQKYIDLASKCFGVKISGDGGSSWTIDSNTKAVNFEDTNYPNSDCKSNSEDWLRLRFWLLDTPTLEGYDCYQGNSATSDQSCSDIGFSNNSSVSNQTTPSPGVDGLVNPLSKIKPLTAKRVDQGVDYAGSGPVLAIGSGEIMSTTNTGWPGGTFIVIKLDALSNKYVYVAENCQNIRVSVGQHVSAGDELCTLVNASPNLEIGWADGSSIGSSLASSVWVGHDSTSYYTAYGENFSQLLQKLGAPAGTIDPSAQKLGSLPAGWPSW